MDMLIGGDGNGPLPKKRTSETGDLNPRPFCGEQEKMTVSAGFQIHVMDRVTDEFLIEITNRAGTEESQAMMKRIIDFISQNYPDARQAVGPDFREAMEFCKVDLLPPLKERMTMRRNPTDDEINTLAAAIADADEDAEGAWPEFDGDDGRREGDSGNIAYRFLLSADDQENYRKMARAAWLAMPSGEAPVVGAEALDKVREQLKQIASRAHSALASI